MSPHRQPLSLIGARVAMLASVGAITTMTPARLCRADDAAQMMGATTPKRTVPDYDGRGNPDAVTGDGAVIWTSRVVLSPLYLTSEFVLRRPLGALTVAAEQADVPRKVYDFFTFGPDHKIGFVPVGFVEFGFTPSFGIYAFWDDAFATNNHLRLHSEMWPSDLFATKVSDRYDIDEMNALEVRFSALTRPDNAFYGIGPKTLQSAESRYTKTGFDASATDEAKLWRSSTLSATFGLRKLDLYAGHWGDDPSLNVAARAGAFPIPFGFDRGYIEPYSRLDMKLDTRPRGATRGSSAALGIDSEQGGDVQHELGSGWIRYGATASATLDLGDSGRLLTLRAGALFADPLGSSPIPFTELVSLGGEKWMYGYFDGRLLGRSALVASLDYAWPIAPWVNGLMQVAVGDVFGEHLVDLDPSLLRISSAIGLAVGTTVPLIVVAGIGTETFAHGTQVDSFRFSLGVPRSF